MIRFNNDYNHGAFASILKELGATNSTSYADTGKMSGAIKQKPS